MPHILSLEQGLQKSDLRITWKGSLGMALKNVCPEAPPQTYYTRICRGEAIHLYPWGESLQAEVKEELLFISSYGISVCKSV